MIKLIEKNTKNDLGQIKLKFLPVINDFIDFNKKQYIVNSLVHSEDCVQILVTENKEHEFFTF